MEWTTILNKQNGRFLKRFVARLSRFGLVVAVGFFLTWKPLFVQGTAGAAELASGIYQALVTTVGGLLVAIPALGAFAVFRNRIDQYVAEAAFLAQQVFGPLRKKKRASERSSS